MEKKNNNSTIFQIAGNHSIQIGQARDVYIISTGGKEQKLPSINKILFYQGDYDLLDNMGYLGNEISQKAITDLLQLELRILLLAIPPEGCITLPPTYYFESEFARNVIRSHANFIDNGYIKLLTEYIDIKDYLELKKERYKKASHINRYKSAYFKNTNHGIKDLNFQFTFKHGSIGENTLTEWGKSIINQAENIQYPLGKIVELRKIVQTTEKPAFLFENVEEHMQDLGISKADAAILQVRTIMNREYLSSYNNQGIHVPQGSSIISDLIVPNNANNQFNLLAWQRIYEQFGLLNKIRSLSSERLLKIKLNPNIGLFISLIRDELESGKHTDFIVGKLMNHKQYKSFIDQFSVS